MKVLLSACLLILSLTGFSQTVPQSPKWNYKAEIIGGGVGAAVGLGLIGWGVHLNGITEFTTTHFGIGTEYKKYGPQSIAVIICGSFGVGGGIYFFAKGFTDRRKHLEQFSLTPTSISVSLRF